MPGRRHARAAVIATTVAWCVDARRVRFCCKTEMGATALGDPQCGRQDLVFVGNRFPAAALDAKVVFELVLGVSSNLCFYFPLRLLAARGRVADCCSCVGLLVTSVCYHVCDTLRVTFLGMNAGNWHRLDNVFAIISFVALVPLLMGRAGSPGGPTRDEVDALRWSALFVGLFFQELNPWNVGCTAAPVALAFAYYVFVWRRRAAPLRKNDDRFARRDFKLALAATAIGLACFVLGLDEDWDTCRVFHSLWHVANATAASLYVAALDPIDRAEHHLASS